MFRVLGNLQGFAWEGSSNIEKFMSLFHFDEKINFILESKSIFRIISSKESDTHIPVLVKSSDKHQQ